MEDNLNIKNVDDIKKAMEHEKKAELNESNIRAMEILKDVIVKHQLEWTDEGIDYILFTENKSFTELRVLDGRRTAIRLIIQAGLKDHDKSKAFKIITELREQGLVAEKLHVLLLNYLRERHFFMGGQDVEDLRNLQEAGVETDVSLLNLLTESLEKMKEINSHL
jgi:hypothetical protein